jgi:hypothetical protein
MQLTKRSILISGGIVVIVALLIGGSFGVVSNETTDRGERERTAREDKGHKEFATWQGYSALTPMPTGTTPGSTTSPFNEEVGTKPEVLSNSKEMVAWLFGPHDVESGQIAPKNISRPSGGPRPVVYASNTDPVVELTPSESYSPLKGRKIRIPAKASVGETSDKHLTIILAPTDAKVPGEAAELWQAEDQTGGTVKIVGGKLKFTGGNYGNITGSLIEGGADSANFDLAAGQIRGPELKAGIVPHALYAVIHADKSSYVYPATGSDGSDAEAAAPSNGQRFYLAYTDAEIEAFKFKPWKMALLKAIAHYGFYVGDSGNTTLSFDWEGSRMYIPFGAPEPFETIGREQGVPREGGRYIFKLSEGVDWTRLRAIAPPRG